MVWPGLAMNYGHFDPHNPYSTAEVNSDLALLKSLGVTRIRVASPPYDSPDMENAKDLTLRALDLDFYVVIGTTTGAAGVTLAKFQEFEQYCLTDLLPWCQEQQNPNLEVHVGNEESLHTAGAGMTLTEVINRLRQLGTDSQLVYTYGPISTTDVSTYIANWVALGKGGLDYISFNCYSLGPVSIKAQADAIVAGFGDNGYISEWGTPHGIQDYDDEKIWEDITQRQISGMVASGVVNAYYFTYRDGSFGLITDAWALKTSNGNYRGVMHNLFGIRHWFTGYPNSPINRGTSAARANTPVRSNTPVRTAY